MRRSKPITQWMPLSVQQLLPMLYAGALALFDVVTQSGQDVPSRDRGVSSDWRALSRSLSQQLGKWDHCYETFDPYEDPPPSPVVCSLSDGLTDICRDLSDGLAKWLRGERDDAVWEWRFGFATHWGRHAVSTLRAIHTLAADHDLGFPR